MHILVAPGLCSVLGTHYCAMRPQESVTSGGLNAKDDSNCEDSGC